MVVWTNCAFLLFLARTCTLYHHVIAVQSVNAEEVTQRRLRRSIPGRLGRDTPDETPAKYEFKTREQAHELQVLIGLYDATDGFNWLDSTGWLSNGVIPCDFKGVACNVDNYVTALDFRDNNLNGTLPASMLWDLQYLERVDLSNNPELTVDFQTDVSLLWETIDDQPDPSDSAFPAVILINETEVVIVTRQAQPNITTAPVHYLDVSNTATSSLAGINRLADTLGILDISNSKVKSDSVGTIRKLSQLTTLGMNHVKFGASVDGFFSQIGPMGMSNVPVETMSNLQYWYASNASLIGTIPSILGLMKTLRVLDMSLNPLQGTLPTEMDNMISLHELYLGHSPDSEEFLDGPLLSFSSLSRLRRLNLSNNRLSGSIPGDLLDGITKNSTLPLSINLKNNELAGPLPTSLLEFSNLDIDVTGNSISGLDPLFCEKDDWMQGEVKNFGCDAILCPPGFWNELGRRVSRQTKCDDCPSLGGAAFYGSTRCDSVVLAAEEANRALSQHDILVAFYTATGGPEWTNSGGWLEEATGGRATDDECGWYGVECQGGRVRSITLPNNNLRGATPSSFFQLTSLRRLVLTDNPQLEVDFRGMLRTNELEDLLISNTATWSIMGLSNATNLQDLEIIGTQISGPNLGDLYSLSTLKTLNMGDNALDQTLPEAIGALTQLVSLRAPNAGLYGTLPTALGVLSSLVILDLAENLLVAPLPEALNQLREVRIFDIHGQKLPLGGTLPTLTGMGSLLQLDLSSNSISGPIPPTFLSGIKDKNRGLRVNLRQNLLTGSLPLELALFQDMNIDVTENQIDGIPEILCVKQNWMNDLVARYGCDAIMCPPGTVNQLGRMVEDESPCEPCETNASLSYFGAVECSVNEEYETVQTLAPTRSELSEREVLELLFESTGGPTSWVRKDNWMNQTADICDWFGVGCDEDGRVQSLDLSGNGLIQSTPVELFELNRLEAVFMDDNPSLNVVLAGIELAQARKRALKGNSRLLQESNLRSLVLSNTATSSLTGLSTVPFLQVLDLNRTRVTGEDLDILMDIRSLEILNIGNTRINRAIPESIANLSNLQELVAQSAGLTGTVPQGVGRLSGLTLLDLSKNALVGTLPDSLGNLTEIQVIDLHDQGLSNGGGFGGSLLSFEKAASLMRLDLSENRFSGEIPTTFLSGISDKKQVLNVNLRRNIISGGLPEELADFSHLNIDVTANQINDLPASFCEQGTWLDGNIESFGCDGLLCPPGTYNANGRQVAALEPCEACPADPSPFFGSNSCLDNEVEDERDLMICPDGSVCYNHGKCEESRSKLGSFVCDCSATGEYGIPFAGLSCEYKATDICHTSDAVGTHNISSFCTNNGRCRERVLPGSEHQGCDCNSDLWTGDFCELSAGLDASVVPEYPSKPTVDIVQICPDEHVCENGSHCVESLEKEGSFECDCNALDKDQLPVAGDSCQYPATSLCSLSPPFNSFCVNGGACVSLVQGGTAHTDCLCPEGFFGSHCETPTVVNTDPKPPNDFMMPDSADEEMESWQMALVFVLPALAIIAIVAMIVAAYGKVKKKNLKYVNVDAIAESEYDKYATEDLESPRKLDFKENDLSASESPQSIVDRALIAVPYEEMEDAPLDTPAGDTAFFSLPNSDSKGVYNEEGDEPAVRGASNERPPLEITTDSPTTSVTKSSDAEDSPLHSPTTTDPAFTAVAARVASAALSEESDQHGSDDEEDEELSTIIEGPETEASDMALHPRSPLKDRGLADESQDEDADEENEPAPETPLNLPIVESRNSSSSKHSETSIATEEFRDALSEKPRVAFAALPSDDDDESNTETNSNFIGDIQEPVDVNTSATGKSLFAGVQSEDSVSFLDHSVAMSEDSERSTSSLPESQRVHVSVEPSLAESMFGGRREASETSSGELSLNF